MSDPASSPPILPARTSVGPNHIQKWLNACEAGQRYEVTFGSTTYTYQLLVLDPSLGVTGERMEAVLRPLLGVLHPCLAKPFAYGEDGGRLWIRSELPSSVALAKFPLPPAAPENPWPLGEPVNDAADLLSLCGGIVPHGIVAHIAADLLEGLAALHRHGVTLGQVDLRSITFHRNHRTHDVVAKWHEYGLAELLDPGAAPRTPKDDLRNVAALLRKMLCGAMSDLPTNCAPQWRDWLARAEAPAPEDPQSAGPDAGFADGGEAYKAFSAVLEGSQLQHPPRYDGTEFAEVPTPVDGTVADNLPRAGGPAARAGSSGHHHHRRRRSRHHRGSSGSMSTSILPENFKTITKMCVIFAGIVGLGWGVYWFLTRELRAAEDGRIGRSALTTNEVAEARLDAFLEKNLWNLGAAQLAERAEKGEALPMSRYAFLLATGGHDVEADPARATALAVAAVEKLRERIREKEGQEGEKIDTNTLFLLGRHLITGFGTKQDPAEAIRLLRQAGYAGNPHTFALSLLGDYYAFADKSRLPDAPPQKECDRIALDYWMETVRNSRFNDPTALVCTANANAFIREGRGFTRETSAPVLAWLESVAREKQYVPAMITLGVICLEGKLAPMDLPRAMNCFRQAATAGNREGMRRMAWMYEHGLTAEKAPATAATWYRRAAENDKGAGDAEAMELLADLLETGTAGLASLTPELLAAAKPTDEDRAEAMRLRAAAREKRKADEAQKAQLDAARTFWWTPPPIEGNDVDAPAPGDAPADAPAPGDAPADEPAAEATAPDDARPLPDESQPLG